MRPVLRALAMLCIGVLVTAAAACGAASEPTASTNASAGGSAAASPTTQATTAPGPAQATESPSSAPDPTDDPDPTAESAPTAAQDPTAAPTTVPSDEATEESGDEPSTSTPQDTQTTTPPADGKRCLVYLHGKGGAGGPTRVTDTGLTVLSPNGNGEGWGALQWVYDSDDALAQASASIVTSIDTEACALVVVHGFSNGASMAAALHCAGNDFGGRLVGVVIDDPVADAATRDCDPATANVVLYWTGALAGAAPVGTNCDQIDWTCAGPVIRGIDAYASDLGIDVTQSPHTDHQWNFETELPAIWLG